MARYVLALVLALGGCGGGKSDPDPPGTPDGGMGSPDAADMTPDAMVAMGDGVDQRITGVVALPDVGDPITCDEQSSVDGICKANAAGIYETRYARTRITGNTKSLRAGEAASVQMNGIPVPVDANGQWSYVYEAAIDCTKPAQSVNLTFAGRLPSSTTAAESVVKVDADLCAPTALWTDGTVEHPHNKVQKESAWAVSFTTIGYVPCMWRKLAPGAGDLTVLDPMATPVVTKYQANMRAEAGNTLMIGPTSAGNTTGCSGVAFAVAPPSTDTHAPATANWINYTFGFSDDHVRSLGVRIRVTDPTGAVTEQLTSFTPTDSNPTMRADLDLLLTATPSTGGKSQYFVAVPALETKPGLYLLDVELTDHFGHTTAAPQVKFTLNLFPGPIQVPINEEVAPTTVFDPVLPFPTTALHGTNDFSPYTLSTNFFLAKVMSIHNRTLKPVTVVLTENGPAVYNWHLKWKIKSAPYQGYEATCPSTQNVAWSGEFERVDVWPAHSAQFMQSGGQCLGNGCRQVRIPAQSEVIVGVGMSAFPEMAFGGMRTVSGGSTVYAQRAATDVQSKEFRFEDNAPPCSTSSDCDSDYSCAFNADQGRKTCGHCLVTYVDRLYALKEFHFETTGNLYFGLSLDAPGDALPWINYVFNGFYGNAYEDVVFP